MYIPLLLISLFLNFDEEFKIDIDYEQHCHNEHFFHIIGITAQQLLDESSYMVEHMNAFCQFLQPTGIDLL